MADKPRASVEIRDFPGLVANADPDDIPPGSGVKQTNVTAIIPGELSTRLGYRTVSFES